MPQFIAYNRTTHSLNASLALVLATVLGARSMQALTRCVLMEPACWPPSACHPPILMFSLLMLMFGAQRICFHISKTQEQGGNEGHVVKSLTDTWKEDQCR